MTCRAKSVTLALLVATSVTFAAGISYSPITCGCVDPWWVLAEFIGHPEIKTAAGLDAQLVEKDIEGQLAQKTVVLNDLPWVGVPEDCVQTTSGAPSIHCRWWIWEHRNSKGVVAAKKGFQVRIDTDGDGRFLRVDVSEVEHINDDQMTRGDT